MSFFNDTPITVKKGAPSPSDKEVPRLKFNYAADIRFRNGTYGDMKDIPIRNASRPRVTVNNREVNFNNFRTKVGVSVVYSPITLVMYDDVGNTALKLYEEYLKEVSSIYGNKAGATFDYDSAEFSSMKATGLIHKNGIVESITVKHMDSALRSGFVKYTYTNPKISAMELDELDSGASDASLVTMTFEIDNVTIETS